MDKDLEPANKHPFRFVGFLFIMIQLNIKVLKEHHLQSKPNERR